MEYQHNMIEFKNISKSFGAVNALSDVSFGIKKGECHAIVGENGAGKSTLMNILSGLFLQDEGEVLIGGQKAAIVSPQVSSQLGIATVYQELKLCPNLTAVENIFLGRTPTSKAGVIKKGDMKEQAVKALSTFGVEIDVNIPVRNLSIAQMQLIELAKAISKNAEVLILDEPTSSLTAAEADKLFEILNSLKAKGKTLIFISHRLTEIFKISDTLSVLRDGKYLGSFACSELDEDKVVKLIAGDKLFNEIYAKRDEQRSAQQLTSTVLEVEGLCRGKLVRDVSFSLHEGEILGLYGLQGAGRTELVETIFGLYPAQSGKIVLHGKSVNIKKTKQAIALGIGLVTEDRKNRGIFDKMDIRSNVAIIHKKKITGLGFIIKNKKITAMVGKYAKELSIKMQSDRQNILGLSGGNQQKVVLARVLSANPGIILADEPTRGVDVGAKAEIFSILRKLKSENKAIIVISSELKEVVKECDRILVMRNGRIVGEVTEREEREEKILNLSFNG